MKKQFKKYNRNIFVYCLVILGLLFSSAAPFLGGALSANASDEDSWVNIYPDEMTKLKTSLVYSGRLVDGTVNSTQSFAVTDKYFVAVQAHSSKENAG